MGRSFTTILLCVVSTRNRFVCDDEHHDYCYDSPLPQYDMCLGCFERAFSLSSTNETSAEIWYNLSVVAMNMGDVGLCYQV